jgi:hypothetical protein
MISSVFKRRRRYKGALEVSKSYYGRYRLDGDFLVSIVCLETSDKLVAERKLAEIIREKERERAGLTSESKKEGKAPAKRERGTENGTQIRTTETDFFGQNAAQPVSNLVTFPSSQPSVSEGLWLILTESVADWKLAERGGFEPPVRG